MIGSMICSTAKAAMLSWAEIAEVVGMQPAAVRKRYERLKARLRKEAKAAATDK